MVGGSTRSYTKGTLSIRGLLCCSFSEHSLDRRSQKHACTNLYNPPTPFFFSFSKKRLMKLPKHWTVEICTKTVAITKPRQLHYSNNFSNKKKIQHSETCSIGFVSSVRSETFTISPPTSIPHSPSSKKKSTDPTSPTRALR